MSASAVASAMRILRCFCAARPVWGVTRLSLETGLGKSHVSKLLRQLAEAGLVVQDPVTKQYRVGQQALVLGSSYLASCELVTRCRDEIQLLASETEFSVTLNIADGRQILFALALDGAVGSPRTWPVGAHLPLHATAAGKVHVALTKDKAEPLLHLPLHPYTRATIRDPSVLARQFDDIRRTGFSVSFGESSWDTGALAAPVVGTDDLFVGAISVLFPLRALATCEAQLKNAIRTTARRASLAMGATAYPFPASQR
jgi:IclR family acetate operon transcriptional repressor